MGNNNNPSYVFLKGNTYYFNRHVPLDVREYYKSDRVILCLKTDRRDKAIRAAYLPAPRMRSIFIDWLEGWDSKGFGEYSVAA